MSHAIRVLLFPPCSRLSSKFGAPQIKWRPLLAAAKRNGLEVVGVSFHVGSGCRDASKYEAALKDARTIFDMAEKEFGMKMRLLDIGGGYVTFQSRIALVC